MAKRALYLERQTEPFQISRAKIEDFVRCPRCFVLDVKHGVKKPSSPPFTLNMAVDNQLKKEFDDYRRIAAVPPVVAAAGLDFVPFSHPDIDTWRATLKGIRFTTEDFIVTGAVDDVWINKAGELIIVDYKATGRRLAVKELGVGGFYDSYRRQMEIYQWLFTMNGFNVSSTGYWLYVTATQTQNVFDGALHFESNLISYVGDTRWISGVLHDIKSTMDNSELPPSGDDCDVCRFTHERNRIVAGFPDQDEQPPVCEDCNEVMSRAVYGMTIGEPGEGFIGMGCTVGMGLEYGIEDPDWVCKSCDGRE